MPAQAALDRGPSLGSVTHSARSGIRGPRRPAGGQHDTQTNPSLVQEVEATGNGKEHHQPDLRSTEQSADAARKQESILRDLPQAHRR